MLKRKDNKNTVHPENDVNEQISNIFFGNDSEHVSNTTVGISNNITNKSAAVPTVGNTLKQARNKNVAWIVLPFFIVICIIVIIVITTLSPANNNKKETTVKEKSRDIPSVFTGLINLNTPVCDYLGMSDIVAGIMSGQSELSANLTLDNLRDAGNNISGTSLELTIDHDSDSNELSSDFSLKYRKANVLSVSTYMNSEALLFKVPAKSDKLFSVNFDKLSEKLKAYFDKYMQDMNFDQSTPENVRTIRTDYITSFISGTSLAGLAGDFTELYGRTDIISLYIDKIRTLYPEDYQRILDGITVSPAESDEHGNFGVTYTISEESFETLVKCVFTVTIEDENLYRLLGPVIIYAMEANVSKFVTADGGVDLSVTLDDILFDLQSVTSAFAAAYSDILSFTVWRNSNGMLTGLKSDNTVTISNNSVSAAFHIETQNNDNPFDNVKVTLTITYQDNSFHLEFDRTTAVDTLLSVKNHLTCSVNDENTIELVFEEALNTSDDSYECHITLTSPDAEDNISLMCSGKFTNISAGESFHFDIGNLYINEGFNNLMTLNGSISADAKKCNVNKPSGKIAELTEMSAEELKKLFGQLGDLIE